MVITSSTSSSSCASLSSLEDISVRSVNSVTGNNTIKFLCSYGGRILPRYPDGKLRYVGGETRVLAVDRSVPFQELQSKLGQICGYNDGVCFRCQLPTEDLDALISITSAEDLANLIEEYDLASRDKSSPLKIRAFLCPLPPPSSTKIPKSTSPTRHGSGGGCYSPRQVVPPAGRYKHQVVAGPGRYSSRLEYNSPRTNAGSHRGCVPYNSPRGNQFLVHHGNNWQ